MTQVCRLIRAELRPLWQRSLYTAFVYVEEIDTYLSTFHDSTTRTTEPFKLEIALGAIYDHKPFTANRSINMLPLLTLMANNPQFTCGKRHLWPELLHQGQMEVADHLSCLLDSFLSIGRLVWGSTVARGELHTAVLKWHWFDVCKLVLTLTLKEGTKTSSITLCDALHKLPYTRRHTSVIRVHTLSTNSGFK